jgi:hypothetical protein
MDGVTKLLRIDLPSGPVFLNDGGVTDYGGNRYRASHPVIGAVQQWGATEFGFGNTLPEWEFVLAPPSNAALGPLQTGAFARSAVRYWIADFDARTGAVIGTPSLEFAGRLDRLRQTFAARQLSIVVSCVPETEALLFSDDGNGLSPEFHKSVYPGETGHDQATGLVLPVTWGVEGGGRAYGGGSGGGGSNPNDVQAF